MNNPSKLTNVPSSHPTALIYYGLVEKAISRRDYHWTTLRTYSNYSTAKTIKWMVEHGRGIKVFADYVPGTFEARVVSGSTVQFRKAR
jgi:hypothetical protein